MFKNTERKYGKIAVLLHWISALLILTMVPLGFLMQKASEDHRLKWYQLHAVIGSFVLLITLARIVWKLIDVKPLPPPGLKGIHLQGMQWVHALLYLTLLVLTINGIILIFQSGLVDVFRGVVTDFPILDEFGSRTAHGLLARIFMGLLFAHIFGVIMHQLRHGHVLARIGIGKQRKRT